MNQTTDPAAPISLGMKSETVLAECSAGVMEVLLDRPAGEPCGWVIVAHPQPLLGGSARHKVPHTLAKALCEAGWLGLRPNFRGVGKSQGTYDEGRGEADDLVALAQQWHRQEPGLPFALLGFSFGAYVQSFVATRLVAMGMHPRHTCLIGMPHGVVDSGRRYDPPPDAPPALVIHGELDTSVPLASILEWARPRARPVTVMTGADHFFTGQLHQVKDLVIERFRKTDR